MSGIPLGLILGSDFFSISATPQSPKKIDSNPPEIFDARLSVALEIYKKCVNRNNFKADECRYGECKQELKAIAKAVEKSKSDTFYVYKTGVAED